MTDGRHPHDGKPYFCALCGDGLAEFANCELPDCELELPHVAEARRARHLSGADDVASVGTDASPRHCEQSEAIQQAANEDWIASSQEAPRNDERGQS